MLDDSDPTRSELSAEAISYLASAGRLVEAQAAGEVAMRGDLDGPAEALALLGLAEALKHAGQEQGGERMRPAWPGPARGAGRDQEPGCRRWPLTRCSGKPTWPAPTPCRGGGVTDWAWPPGELGASRCSDARPAAWWRWPTDVSIDAVAHVPAARSAYARHRWW